MVSSPEAAVSALSASVSSGRIASAADGASVTGASFKRSSAVFPAFSAVSAFSGWSALSEFPVSSVLVGKLPEHPGSLPLAPGTESLLESLSVFPQGLLPPGSGFLLHFLPEPGYQKNHSPGDSPADGVSAVSDEA